MKIAVEMQRIQSLAALRSERELGRRENLPLKNLLLTIFALFLFGNSAAIAEQASGSASLSKPEAKALEAIAATPEEHTRLAKYYREEESKFDQKARYHGEMREIYRRNPLPFDGKMAVPMERHCSEWVRNYDREAERASVLAAFHEQRELGTTPAPIVITQMARRGLRSSGFSGPGASALTTEVTREQRSLFHASLTASTRFYDQARILTYLVSAGKQPPIETAELRKAAATLFDFQREFVEALTEPQKALIDAHLATLEKLRQKMEATLHQLEATTATPASKAYFKAANGIKRSLESWNSEQQGIALQFRIEE